jgi:hypothetical protein
LLRSHFCISELVGELVRRPSRRSRDLTRAGGSGSLARKYPS